MSIVALSPAVVVVTTVCFNLLLVYFVKDRDQPKSQRAHLSGVVFSERHMDWCGTQGGL